jgi:hypothetical protein
MATRNKGTTDVWIKINSAFLRCLAHNVLFDDPWFGKKRKQKHKQDICDFWWIMNKLHPNEDNIMALTCLHTKSGFEFFVIIEE